MAIESLDQSQEASVAASNSDVEHVAPAGAPDSKSRARALDLARLTWEQRFTAWKQHAESQREVVERLEERERIRPELQRWLERLVAGEERFRDLQVEFDRRSRGEWGCFALGGPSGAMVFNKWAKHHPQPARVHAMLREIVPLPKSPDEATASLRRLYAFALEAIDTHGLQSKQMEPKRAVRFMTCLWGVQARDDYYCMYSSAIRALVAFGLLENGQHPVDQFDSFRAAFDHLCPQLGASRAELASFLYWLDQQSAKQTADADFPKPSLPPASIKIEAAPRPRAWLIAPGPGASLWKEWYSRREATIGWGPLGDLSQLDSREAVQAEMGRALPGQSSSPQNVLACYQFAHEMQVGDEIFAKRGVQRLVGHGVITSAYRYEPSRGEYAHVRSVKWDEVREAEIKDFQLVTKTLTEIGKYEGFPGQLRQLLGLEAAAPTEALPPTTAAPASASYEMADALEDLFLEEGEVRKLQELLLRKRNLVLQGPPGVGKTFIARRLAYLLLGERSNSRIRTVQFHQSYAYEDFVQGFRPASSGGFERRPGPFLTFCQQALQDQDEQYVLIIDEINRGNLSRIFGELLMLLEPDKRTPEYALQLAYSRPDEPPFFVPPNLYLIGTMNTADRSLALVDYALRRRFAFFELAPADGGRLNLHLEQRKVSDTLRPRILERWQELNQLIRQDPALGMGYMVGHSYFCHPPDQADEEWYDQVIEFEILPLLREYWFDNPEQLKRAQQLLDLDA